MKRIGLMGCGHVADYGHIPAIKQTEGLELLSVFDPDFSRALNAQKKYGIPHAYCDSELFFSQNALDAVVVTSPAPCHLQNVKDAAAHKLHVLCEKPLAMTEEDTQTMIDIMSDAKLMLFTGFCYRFSPSSLKIRELISQGEIGEVRLLRLVYIWNLHGEYQHVLPTHHHEVNGFQVARLNSLRVGRMLEGGPMVDCGVHQIDLARWWLQSEVIRSQAAGGWIEDYEAPDHMWLHLDHESGAHSMVEISFAYCHTATEPISHFSYHIIGTDGVIRYDRENLVMEVRTSSGTHRHQWHGEKNFHGMYQELSRALHIGAQLELPTGSDGLIATRIARTATERVIESKLPRGDAEWEQEEGALS